MLEDRELGICVCADVERWFAFSDWEEAFQFWQHKIWSRRLNKGAKLEKEAGNAIITIQTEQNGTLMQTYLSITFDTRHGLYEATGHGGKLIFETHNVLYSTCTSDFEIALARFSRDRSIEGVHLPLPNAQYVSAMQLKRTQDNKLLVGIG